MGIPQMPGQNLQVRWDRVPAAHQGGPLHEGKLDDGCITCLWHSSRFRLSDGAR
jgi:hypothetical protein